MHFTGHKTSAMFERYNTIDEDDAKEALRKSDRFLDGAGEENGRSEECSHSAPKEKEAKWGIGRRYLTPMNYFK